MSHTLLSVHHGRAHGTHHPKEADPRGAWSPRHRERMLDYSAHLTSTNGISYADRCLQSDLRFLRSSTNPRKWPSCTSGCTSGCSRRSPAPPRPAPAPLKIVWWCKSQIPNQSFKVDPPQPSNFYFVYLLVNNRATVARNRVRIPAAARRRHPPDGLVSLFQPSVSHQGQSFPEFALSTDLPRPRPPHRRLTPFSHPAL